MVAAEGIDLGEFTFEEDSVVDTMLVPLAQGKVSQLLSFTMGLLKVTQVCSTCRTKKKRGCVPIWHLNKSLMMVRCPACMKDKQGCSFKEWDWGISVLPQLTKTESGVVQRAQEVGHKAGEEVITMPQDLASTVGTHLRRKKVTEVVPLTTLPPPDFARLPGALSTPVLLLGSIHSIFIEDFLPFDVALADPCHSAISAGGANINRRAGGGGRANATASGSSMRLEDMEGDGERTEGGGAGAQDT